MNIEKIMNRYGRTVCAVDGNGKKIAEKSNPGICRALCVIDITSGLDIKKSDAPEDNKKENEKDTSNDEDNKIVDDLTKDLPDDIKSLMGESVNNTSLMNYLLQQINM